MIDSEQFPLCKGSHHMQPPNQSLAKMNGTQSGKSLKNALEYCSMPKGTPWAEAMLKSEKSIPQTYPLSSYTSLKASVS